jgi:hypothetical protein
MGVCTTPKDWSGAHDPIATFRRANTEAAAPSALASANVIGSISARLRRDGVHRQQPQHRNLPKVRAMDRHGDCVCKGHHGWTRFNEARYNKIVRVLTGPERCGLWDKMHDERYKPKRNTTYNWNLELAALNQEVFKLHRVL